MTTSFHIVAAAVACVWVAALWAAESVKLPQLVDLGADKCIPGKTRAPILEGLKKEYAGRMNVEFIDVWKNPAAGRPYEIKLIPTQIFFDASRKELFRHEGFFGKEDILAKWKELGVDVTGGNPKAPGPHPADRRFRPAVNAARFTRSECARGTDLSLPVTSGEVLALTPRGRQRTSDLESARRSMLRFAWPRFPGRGAA